MIGRDSKKQLSVQRHPLAGLSVWAWFALHQSLASGYVNSWNPAVGRQHMQRWLFTKQLLAKNT